MTMPPSSGRANDSIGERGARITPPGPTAGAAPWAGETVAAEALATEALAAHALASAKAAAAEAALSPAKALAVAEVGAPALDGVERLLHYRRVDPLEADHPDRLGRVGGGNFER